MEEQFSVKALFARIHKMEMQDHDDLKSYQRVPIQLIKLSKQGKLKLCKAGAEYLKQIQGRIAVIGMCGQQRSGKSALLNLLINNAGSGFALSHDASKKTEGIWIWGEPIRTKENSILFLDCEGVKSIENSTNIDAKIFTIMALLSSVLVYNIKGVIDEKSISQLAFGTCFSEIIDYRNGYADSDLEINERITAESPKFIWLLRDFNLSITDDNGNSISSKEYMENILNASSYMGKNASNNNEMRELILKAFKERDCITMPRPVAHEKDLERFEDLQFEDLRPMFQKSFEKFKIGIMEFCPSKKIHGIEVTGFQVAALIQDLIHSMNESEVPNLYVSWDYAVRLQYEEIFNKAKNQYMECKDIDPALMPYEEKELLEKVQTAKESAVMILCEIPGRNENLDIEMFENLQDFFNDDLKNLIRSNFIASEAFNLSLLEELYREIIEKIDDGYFSGNFELMESEWIKNMKMYEKQAKGPAKFLAISEFSRNHQHSAFSKFFGEILEKYKEELEMLRYKDRESKERLKNQEVQNERQEIIEQHVKCI